MSKGFRQGKLLLFTLAMVLCFHIHAYAGEDTIRDGVYAGNIQLSGLTPEEATARIQEYVDGLGDARVVLVAAGDREVTVTAAQLGLEWNNPELVHHAATLGTTGNVIQRYKQIKDLQVENKVYDIELAFDVLAINHILVEQCSQYDQPAINASMIRENDQFVITEGQVGYELDVETSIDVIYDYLENEWDGRDCRIQLDVAVTQPKGRAEDLAVVTDLLGSYTTDYSGSNSNRSGNVKNGCEKINGTVLYPGEEFSATDTVSPFTVENGYALAGAYLNGKVVNSIGGGICQVTTTLYNAVLLAELEVTQRNAHSMIVSYVAPSADAAIAESAGKDFCFKNNTEYPIYLEGFVKNKKITFNIYGKEVRDAGREVSYESEILEVINPTADIITADPGKPLGYITTQEAHIGYKARLWKIVKENGKEVSRTIVNNSKYNLAPRSAVVGVATEDPQKYEEIMAAIGTYDIEHVKVVIGLLTQPAQ